MPAPDEAVAVEVELEGLHGGEQHVQPEVELEAAHQQRVAEVPLDRQTLPGVEHLVISAVSKTFPMLLLKSSKKVVFLSEISSK